MTDVNIQQTPFVKQLAANDRPTRDAAVASLKSFLSAKRAFTRLDFMKLWKGLFYCMWMSDRPRTQQNLANELASLVDVLKEENYILFMEVFWTTMAREWNSIDVLRMDKFLLLVRRYLASSFKYLETRNWEQDLTAQYMTVLESIPLHPTQLKIPNGLRYHVIDIYLDEIEKLYPEAEAKHTSTAPPPMDLLMQPLRTLQAQTPTKPVKLRLRELFMDKRLQTWGHNGTEGGTAAKVQPAKDMDEMDVGSEDEEEEDDDDDEEEWGGIDD